MYDHYFSNFGRPPVSDGICKNSAIRHPRFWRRFLKVFPIKCIGKQTWPCRKKVKCQYTTFILAILVDPPIPDDLSKDSAPRHTRFWRRRFLKVFTIYGHDGHLGQRTETILANIHSLNLRRLHMKFEQNWPRGSRGEVVWNSEHFSHTNA